MASAAMSPPAGGNEVPIYDQRNDNTMDNGGIFHGFNAGVHPGMNSGVNQLQPLNTDASNVLYAIPEQLQSPVAECFLGIGDGIVKLLSIIFQDEERLLQRNEEYMRFQERRYEIGSRVAEAIPSGAGTNGFNSDLNSIIATSLVRGSKEFSRRYEYDIHGNEYDVNDKNAFSNSFVDRKFRSFADAHNRRVSRTRSEETLSSDDPIFPWGTRSTGSKYARVFEHFSRLSETRSQVSSHELSTLLRECLRTCETTPVYISTDKSNSNSESVYPDSRSGWNKITNPETSRSESKNSPNNTSRNGSKVINSRSGSNIVVFPRNSKSNLRSKDPSKSSVVFMQGGVSIHQSFGQETIYDFQEMRVERDVLLPDMDAFPSENSLIECACVEESEEEVWKFSSSRNSFQKVTPPGGVFQAYGQQRVPCQRGSIPNLSKNTPQQSKRSSLQSSKIFGGDQQPGHRYFHKPNVGFPKGGFPSGSSSPYLGFPTRDSPHVGFPIGNPLRLVTSNPNLRGGSPHPELRDFSQLRDLLSVTTQMTASMSRICRNSENGLSSGTGSTTGASQMYGLHQTDGVNHQGGVQQMNGVGQTQSTPLSEVAKERILNERMNAKRGSINNLEKRRQEKRKRLSMQHHLVFDEVSSVLRAKCEVGVLREEPLGKGTVLSRELSSELSRHSFSSHSSEESRIHSSSSEQILSVLSIDSQSSKPNEKTVIERHWRLQLMPSRQ